MNHSSLIVLDRSAKYRQAQLSNFSRLHCFHGSMMGQHFKSSMLACSQAAAAGAAASRVQGLVRRAAGASGEWRIPGAHTSMFLGFTVLDVTKTSGLEVISTINRT